MAVSVKISRRFLMYLSTIFLVSWITGLLFFYLNGWVTVEGDFGPEKHPWQFGVLKIHGASAFFMMITFGYLIASHVSIGWHVKKLKTIGLTLVSATGFMIATAYGLYYLGDEGTREIVRYAHISVGSCLPLFFLAHILQAKQRRRRRSKMKQFLY